MDKKEKGSAYWIMVLLAGLVLGVIAGLAIADFSYPLYQSDKWASWVQAVGSIGAVFSGFALNYYNQTRRSRRSVKGLIFGAKSLRNNISKVVAEFSHIDANESPTAAGLNLYKNQTMSDGSIRQVFFSPNFNLDELKAAVQLMESIDRTILPYMAAFYLETVASHYRELLSKIEWQLKWCSGVSGNPYDPFNVDVIDELTKLERELAESFIS